MYYSFVQKLSYTVTINDMIVVTMIYTIHGIELPRMSAYNHWAYYATIDEARYGA